MSVLEQKAFISDIPPFNQLLSHEVEAVADAMDIAYFKKGEQLIQQDSSPKALYIIIKGIVQETYGDEMVSAYVSQDSFDAMSLLEGKSKNNFTVQEELICYVLPKEIFLILIQHNELFKEFYYQDLSKRLNVLLEQRNSKELASFMVAKIKDTYVHPPVFVDANISVYEAVQTMTARKANFVLVKNNNDIGIVTDKDLRDMVLKRYSIDDPVGNIATYNLISMCCKDFLLHALLVMLRHSIKHLLIKKDNLVIGVLEQIDLLSYLSNHTRLVAVQIDRAENKEQLKVASQNMTNMVKSFQASGMKIGYMMQWVNELNLQVFKKLYSFVAPSELLENSCLIVMGSEGRGEQILKTDQDNAMILRDGFVYEGLENITKELTETLVDFGYPPCPGKIMVNNSRWCQPLKNFKAQIFEWVIESQEPLLDLAIFCDAKAVAGDETLLKKAKQYLYDRLQDNQAFFSYFAKPTLSFETPLGFFTTFIVDRSKEDQLDIKKGGIFPIVHGVRSLALEHKITQTNTLKRIKYLTQKGIIDKAFAADLIEALAFMISIRLYFELEKMKQGEPYNNYINPSQLNKLERDLLKDSFKIVNDFKKFIIYHFKLDRLS
ncbi:putative nucleotidyltransferase substrate binding domain-containing protein [Candidatus Parabeggiatoa sp. HSG14]|uniref:putative nucleotidyltransferase substrate binding domain-containing protein n=1 Tax=Candidatus Parabeggiatoa sp. HSG14 TaxID=3055593 RepID=UPI0025A8E03D|nr:putative nucleotidyltransferase substrate binding domain-containing protein [Thiotrichales bacterium HSG14]